MSEETKPFVIGPCVDIKVIKSQGVTRMLIEVPEEYHKALVGAFFNEDVMVVLAPQDAAGQGYGLFESRGDALEEAPRQRGSRDDGESLAHRMHRVGYFMNPRLWEAMEKAGIYTQDDHKAWLESCPCALRGGGDLRNKHFDLFPPKLQDKELLACNGDVVEHHIRTALNAGTSTKPPHWDGVPLCGAHHDAIHRHCTAQFRDFLLTIAMETTAARMKSAMRKFLGRESMSGITADELRAFEAEIEFNGLPGLYS